MAESQILRRAIPPGAQINTWRSPDDWAFRAFAWPVQGRARGSILFEGGRGDIFEKYLETFHHWHDQGWTITSLDWRGQGGSGRLTAAPHCGHIEDFAQYIDDIATFFAEWRAATPGPHVVIGHSMGGHLILRAMVEGAIAPDVAVLVAPMLGLKAPMGQALGERLARTLGGVGDSARPAWKGNEKPYTTETRESLLTHDHDRYSDELWWQAHDPRLLTGPPSWRWVIEAFRSTRELRADPRLKTMKIPVLGLVAEVDGLVDGKIGAATMAKLPDARIVRFGRESAHEILREGDKVRNRAIGEIDLFLAARAPRQ